MPRLAGTRRIELDPASPRRSNSEATSCDKNCNPASCDTRKAVAAISPRITMGKRFVIVVCWGDKLFCTTTLPVNCQSLRTGDQTSQIVVVPNRLKVSSYSGFGLSFFIKQRQRQVPFDLGVVARRPRDILYHLAKPPESPSLAHGQANAGRYGSWQFLREAAHWCVPVHPVLQ